MTDWCLVVGCVGLVLAAELFSSAVETLYHALDAEARARPGCLNIAAARSSSPASRPRSSALVFTQRILILLHIWEE